MHSACTAESHAALVWTVPQSSQAVSPGPAAVRPACPGNPPASCWVGERSQCRPQTMTSSVAPQPKCLPTCRSRTLGAGAAPSTPTWWTRTPQSLMTTMLWPSPCRTSTSKSSAALPRSLAGPLVVCTHAPGAGVSCAAPLHLCRPKQVPHAAAHDAAVHSRAYPACLPHAQAAQCRCVHAGPSGCPTTSPKRTSPLPFRAQTTLLPDTEDLCKRTDSEGHIQNFSA